MTHSSVVRGGSSVRHILHRTVGWLAMALSVICGVLGAAAAFFGAALLFSTIVALLLVALGAGFLLTCGGAWGAARMLRHAHPGRIALGVSAATMLVLALVASLTVFQPLSSSPTPDNLRQSLLVCATGT